MENTTFIRIGTHDNLFHDDDVTAVAVLTSIFKNYEIIRTRDLELLNDCDFVVDVGDVYDHTLRRYDHHMPNPPKADNGHIYSSAGLIWKHYAKAYLQAINIPKVAFIDDIIVDIASEVEKVIWNRWIYMIDAVDNGEMAGPTVISEVVKSMRPIFPEKTRDRCDELFEDTVKIISKILERACFHCADQIISRAQFGNSSKRLLHSGKILVSETFVPTNNQLCESGVHFTIARVKTYVDEDVYRTIISPIRTAPHRAYKTPIHGNLLGLKQDDIEAMTGCKGITFIHHSGFIAFADDEESAITFCDYLLSYNHQTEMD